MFQLSLFIECAFESEALDVLNEVIRKLNDEISSFNVIENEPYWKIDGWFKITCNFESRYMVDYQQAENVLNFISDKWLWDKGKASAHSSAKDMSAIFFNPLIKFSTCWFEELG